MFQLVLDDHQQGKVVGALGREGDWVVGRDRESAVLVIDDPSVKPTHAILRARGAAFTLESLHENNVVIVDGARLPLHAPTELVLGKPFRIGGCDLFIRKTPRDASAAPSSGFLVEWCQASDESCDLDKRTLWKEYEPHAAMRWTAVGREQAPLELARDVLRTLVTGQLAAADGTVLKFESSLARFLPLAPSLVLDIAMTMWDARVPLRRTGLSEEVGRFKSVVLQRLARDAAIDSLRQHLTNGGNRERRIMCAAHAYRLLSSAWRDAWLEADKQRVVRALAKTAWRSPAADFARALRDQGLPLAAEMLASVQRSIGSELELRAVLDQQFATRWDASFRWLPPAWTPAFLQRLAEVLDGGRSRAAHFKPFEGFLLRTTSRVPDAFAGFDVALIDRCLCTRDLEERFDVQPMRLELDAPQTLLPEPGSDVDVRSVRTSHRIEELPNALPQELALLKTSRGAERLLHKAANEGFLIWLRRARRDELTRRTYFAAFVADVGIAAVSGGDRAESPDQRARKLILQSVRDLAQVLDGPLVELELHVFLEPVGGVAERGMPRRHSSFDGENLRNARVSELQDLMIELEVRLPAYFIKSRVHASTSVIEPREFLVERLESRRFDRSACVFLGPTSTVWSLLPWGNAVDRAARSMAVRVVELDAARNQLDVSVGSSFAAVGSLPRAARMSEPQLRAAIVRDLLGAELEPGTAPALEVLR